MLVRVPPAVAALASSILMTGASRRQIHTLAEEVSASLASDRLILSGYNEKPRMASAIVNFHEPLVEALKRAEADSGGPWDASSAVAMRPRATKK